MASDGIIAGLEKTVLHEMAAKVSLRRTVSLDEAVDLDKNSLQRGINEDPARPVQDAQLVPLNVDLQGGNWPLSDQIVETPHCNRYPSGHDDVIEPVPADRKLDLSVLLAHG